MSIAIPQTKRKEDKATAYIKKTDNPRMGRPTTNPKTVSLHLRLSQAESELLEECAAHAGKNKTDIIIEGITLVHKELQKENP